MRACRIHLRISKDGQFKRHSTYLGQWSKYLLAYHTRSWRAFAHVPHRGKSSGRSSSSSAGSKIPPASCIALRISRGRFKNAHGLIFFAARRFERSLLGDSISGSLSDAADSSSGRAEPFLASRCDGSGERGVCGASSSTSPFDLLEASRLGPGVLFREVKVLSPVEAIAFASSVSMLRRALGREGRDNDGPA